MIGLEESLIPYNNGVKPMWADVVDFATSAL